MIIQAMIQGNHLVLGFKCALFPHARGLVFRTEMSEVVWSSEEGNPGEPHEEL